MDTKLVSEADWAQERGDSVRTLQRERALGISAPFIKIGRRVYYRRAAIEEWLLAKEIIPPRSPVRRRV